MTVQDLIKPGKYRLRVADFRLLDEAGAFGEQRTELIGGDVIVMSPEHRPHFFIKSELTFLLRVALRELGSDLYVGGGGSVAFSDHDEPLPDIIVTREPRGDGPIPAASVALLVEVAATTHALDLGAKADLYAGGGVAEYWVADVTKRAIHLFSEPGPDGYLSKEQIRFGEPIRAQSIAGLTIDTTNLL